MAMNILNVFYVGLNNFKYKCHFFIHIPSVFISTIYAALMYLHWLITPSSSPNMLIGSSVPNYAFLFWLLGTFHWILKIIIIIIHLLFCNVVLLFYIIMSIFWMYFSLKFKIWILKYLKYTLTRWITIQITV